MMNWKVLLTTAALASLAAQPAFAHVTLEVAEAAAGTTYKAVLRVPHGCAGEATTAIRVKLPEGVFNAKPMPKPHWELTTQEGSHSKAYVSHGTEITSGVLEISWEGGELLDDWYDEFVFRVAIDSELEPGTVLYFPVLQMCGSAEEAWIDTTGVEGADMPAPTLTIVDSGHSH
jgi:periplasmic copper chaperone A